MSTVLEQADAIGLRSRYPRGTFQRNDLQPRERHRGLKNRSSPSSRRLGAAQIPLTQIDVPEGRPNFNPKTQENSVFIQWAGRSTHETREFINPCNVRKVGERYQLVCGWRRYHVAKYMGWKTITCKIEKWTDRQVEFLGLVENLHRHKMKPAEEALANQKLLKAFKDSSARIQERPSEVSPGPRTPR